MKVKPNQFKIFRLNKDLVKKNLIKIYIQFYYFYKKWVQKIREDKMIFQNVVR